MIKNRLNTLFFLMTSTLITFGQSPSYIKQKIDSLTNQKKAIENNIKQLESSLPAAPTPIWTYVGNLSVNIGQTSLTNWAAGGTSNFSLLLVGHGEANMKKDKHSWGNSIDARYGFIKNFDPALGVNDPIQKNNDYLQLKTQYAYDYSKNGKWRASLLVNLVTQFNNTYSSANSDNLISTFFAPAILDIAPGIEYKPTNDLSIFFTPVSGRFNFVLNSYLINQDGGSYGNAQGQKIRTELGARFDATYEKELLKNFKLRSRLQLFDNWTRGDVDYYGKTKRFNVDVNWQTDIIYKLSKFLSLNLSVLMLYDDDNMIYSKDLNKKRPVLQLKEAFGIGIVYGLK